MDKIQVKVNQEDTELNNVINNILYHAIKRPTTHHRLKPAFVSIKPDESGYEINLFEQV